jgi:catechol 2,3-dioxygenase-like lactoylglutathione lyase family enzyme
MLAEGNVCATIAVSDLAKGKEFYGGVLGLEQVDENPGGVTFKSGDKSSLFVYQSEFAGSNKATCAAWQVDDVKGTVAELKSKGVVFESYPDMPMTTWDGDVAKMDGADWLGAWFKDPDGNIFSLGNM